ncbi:hypothetical protein BVRB_1g016290 [Beta vulgaris subsp. vulgaris]|nr:hypothetical protein BVRB_1g016290 [Beta vulgaris subsp. vulgaris]
MSSSLSPLLSLFSSIRLAFRSCSTTVVRQIQSSSSSPFSRPPFVLFLQVVSRRPTRSRQISATIVVPREVVRSQPPSSSHAKSSDLSRLRRFQPPSPRVPPLYRRCLVAALAALPAVSSCPFSMFAASNRLF